jgi:hypothetical protein
MRVLCRKFGFKSRLQNAFRQGSGFALAVEAQEVVQWGAESGDWGKEFKRAMRSVPVVAVEEGREACGAF